MGTPPVWHGGLPGPSCPEPQKSPKRARKGVPGPPGPSPRLPKECALGLEFPNGAHSLGTLGIPGTGAPGTPFRTLFGLFWGSGPEGPGALRARPGGFPRLGVIPRTFRKAPDTFNSFRHVMRATLSVRPKSSHKCVSRKETPLKPVQILKHATRKSTEQTSMRTKWFKHIAI